MLTSLLDPGTRRVLMPKMACVLVETLRRMLVKHRTDLTRNIHWLGCHHSSMVSDEHTGTVRKNYGYQNCQKMLTVQDLHWFDMFQC